MKKILFIFLFFTISLTLNFFTYAREVGDIMVFKSDGKMWGWDSIEGGTYAWNYSGHAAIFLGMNESGAHYSVEALNPDQGVMIITREVDEMGNLLNTNFLGYYSYNNPTNNQRKIICIFGRQQNEKLYSEKPGIGVEGFIHEKGPERFSCVGLAEKCYETAGIDITPDGYGRSIVAGDSLFDNWIDKEETHYYTGFLNPVPNFWVFFPYSQLYIQTHKNHADNTIRMTP